MRVSDKGIFALAKHEGIVPAPYRDSVGVITYGIGHTKAAGDPDPDSLPRGMPADLDAALRDVFNVFRRDLESYSEAVRREVKVPVEQHEFDALVSFHFNTGGIARAAVTRHLNAGDRGAAAKAFMNWRRPPEVIPRREDEEKLFREGVYPSGTVPVWQVTDTERVIWDPAKSLSMTQVLDLLDDPDAKPSTLRAKPEPPKLVNRFLAFILRLLGRAS